MKSIKMHVLPVNISGLSVRTLNPSIPLCQHLRTVVCTQRHPPGVSHPKKLTHVTHSLKKAQDTFEENEYCYS